MKQVIGVFDSGVGGMTTLLEIKKLIPDAKTIYFGDSEHCPYGERIQEELINITHDVVKKLADQGARIIVIACNTATTMCIVRLRQLFPDLTFVGTEPALKVACDHGCKNIVLMATPGTIQSRQVKRLVKQNFNDQKLTMVACPGLAELIEKSVTIKNDVPDFSFNSDIKNKLNELLLNLPDRDKVDAVVLGCTHYNYLDKQLAKYFPNAEMVNGNLGVAKQVRTLMNVNLQ